MPKKPLKLYFNLGWLWFVVCYSSKFCCSQLFDNLTKLSSYESNVFLRHTMYYCAYGQNELT